MGTRTLSRRELNVAIVGSGLMGEAHSRAAAHAGARIVAVSDIDETRASELSRRARAAVLSSDEIFSRDDIDAVHICVPPEQHFRLCLEALTAGCNVLCEKPVAQSAAEVIQLSELAAQQGIVLCAAHQFPFQDGVFKVLREREKIGSIIKLRAEIRTAGAIGRSQDFMHHLALDIVTHPLSLFRTFGVAPLERIDWIVTVPRAGEISIAGTFNEIGLSIEVSTRGRPPTNAFDLIGADAAASIDLFHGYAVIEPGKVSRLAKAARPFSKSARTVSAALVNGVRRTFSSETEFPGLRRLVALFYDALENKSPSPVSSEEMADIALARDRIMALSSDRFRAQ